MPLSVPPSQCVSYCPLSVDALSSHSVYLKQYCPAAISKTTFFSVYTPDLRFISLAPTFQLSLGRFFLQLCFLSCSMHLSVSSKSCFCLFYYISPCPSVSPDQLCPQLFLSLCPFLKMCFACLSNMICLSVSLHLTSHLSLGVCGAYRPSCVYQSCLHSHKDDSFSVSALFSALWQ